MLDTLSVIESSIRFFDKDGKPITCDYEFDFTKSQLVFKQAPPEGTRIEFRSFPVNFSKPVSRFDRQKYMLSQHTEAVSGYDFVFTPESSSDFFSQTSLSRKGSISRGISFGNSQNMIMNSNLDLQLDGSIGSNLYISAAISDNNIPIQPDGNSQQIQEFDKVFIKIYNSRFHIIAGDFEQQKPQGYFLNFSKKSQGLQVAGNWESTDNQKTRYTTYASASAAVAKGKYHKMQINGSEGNQGPYKLTGANNEVYVVVLAGTEKIYIDGILLQRGSDRDYTIDYNLGEITFTAHQPITKDKRITAEFEYSDQNYTRFLVTSEARAKIDNTEVWLNLYHEGDAKNQPINLDLNDSQKFHLRNAGDNPLQTLIPSGDSLGFNPNEVRYSLTDTLVDGILYDSVFVFSTNPEKAFFRVMFSLVGENNGDYVRDISAANGRVYKWVAPINGVKQGNYAPYIKLVPPEKKQIATIGAKSQITKTTNASIELALSNNDKNTFSKIDSDDDFGLGVKTSFEQFIINTKRNLLSFDVNYEFLSKNFEAVEYFRQTEFTRDWNLSSYYAEHHSENLVAGNIKFNNYKHGTSVFSTSYINRGLEYKGWQNRLTANYKFGTWRINGEASFLTSNDSVNETQFLRHNLSLSKTFLRVLDLGLSENSEDNRWKNNEGNLQANSYRFGEYQFYISTADSLQQRVRLAYTFRNDEKPIINQLVNSTQAHNFTLSSEVGGKNNHRLKTTVNYRLLKVCDTTLYQAEPENNLIGKIEYNFNLWKGVLRSTTLYEIGSGLENKTEYTYIEVAAGQGVYTWTDYNGNGVQEIDEFEIAFFADQANFIRVQMPSTEYIKVYSNQFNQSLSLSAPSSWKQKKGIRKFVSRFSNVFAYSTAQKNTSQRLAEFANPFANNIDIEELVSLNSTIRNSFSINKGKPKFGADYIIQQAKSKSLLTSGFDSRTNLSHNVLLRSNITTKIGLQNTTSFGTKSYESQFFATKNYQIRSIKNQFQFNFQPNINNRLSLEYNYEQKANKLGAEQLQSHNGGIEYRLNSTKRGSLNANINCIYYRYSSSNNAAIDYEMLQGLQAGLNFTWGVSFQRQLANGLQINISYTGRKSQETRIIHTASMELRAYF